MVVDEGELFKCASQAAYVFVLRLRLFERWRLLIVMNAVQGSLTVFVKRAKVLLR